MTQACVICVPCTSRHGLHKGSFQGFFRYIPTILSHVAGVAYPTATKLVNAFGASVLGIMDEPDCVERLSRVPGIGPTSATKFKQSWDASRGRINAPTLP